MSRQKMAIGALALAFCAGAAHGVVRNDLGAGTIADYKFSVKFGGHVGYVATDGYHSSGTLIGGGRFVITAKHSIDQGNDATKYKIKGQDGVVLSGKPGTLVHLHPTEDVAIVELDGWRPDWISIYKDTDELNKEVSFAGWGLSATAPGNGLDNVAYGTLRIGANQIDTANASFLQFDFDLDTDLTDADNSGGLGAREATTFGGDSGMGWFITKDGVTKLAGVHRSILGNVNVDEVVSRATRLSQINAWINEQIPTPGAVTMASLAGVLLVARRRR